ncbi:hypothetical protein [Sporosalibacterium faouarense]|uniref:hypothetical protein n=1 Tax=Sporosalibacterium faouarense TaxID=516123 RepID=UPI00141D5D1E|nr:hypothetical protein [Sporosalibacterium faouarense]MTI46717.1 hypothetical protein [Bacillota bacterium]
MVSGKVRSMDPYSGVVEMEIYNINNLDSKQNNYFQAINPDISVNQNTEHFQIRFGGENKKTRILMTNN